MPDRAHNSTGRNRAAVLLAAGSGSRLRPLTDDTPKCLLPVGNRTVLDWMLDSVLDAPKREVVIVAGYAGDKVARHVEQHYSDSGVRVVCNDDYANDVNILSVDIGVNSLNEPDRGYSIIETDLLLSPSAWRRILDDSNIQYSFWVTRGRYSADLTGGIVHVKADGSKIDGISYVPEFDPHYVGWNKMVGILSVGPDQVRADRHWRRKAIQVTSAQYYMMPWINHAEELPCQVMDLGDAFASSFNTINDYRSASELFLEHVRQ